MKIQELHWCIHIYEERVREKDTEKWKRRILAQIIQNSYLVGSIINQTFRTIKQTTGITNFVIYFYFTNNLSNKNL